ncbi:spore germination protein GerPC [Sutcliffiella halmapala]|uniref:spore germination protein GerPC n=1 Tax=Sutcliffiella halmapala TaxID=79882 RepID=UPI00099555AD|nr:spore germination protein GerPC [Sutcliffiella halmapala]
MYYNYQYFYESQQQIKQLQDIVEKQSKQITTLEEILKKMQQEIIQIKQKPSMNIEKIEYKFDQLKVETLEGTLNIGLTPGSTGEIEDFVVTQNNLEVPVPQRNQQLAKEIETDIRNQLTKNGQDTIKGLAKKQGKVLEEHYYDFMIQDVCKQLPSRINHCLNTVTSEALEKGYSDEKIKAVTVQQLQADMNKAFATFIQNLPQNN